MGNSNSRNKIKYNLKNVHAAVMTRDASGGYLYGTPKAIPGAVSLSLDAEGETNPFYADGIVYFRSVSNNGYSGDLEIALIPDWFREEILKEAKDINGVLVETNNDTNPVYFALLFEFDGDKKAIRHVLYNCAVSARPTLESSTKEDTIEPGTETLSLAADAREDGLIKARSGDDTTSEAYSGWYDSVYLPMPGEAARLSSLTVGSLALSPAFTAATTSYTASASGSSDTVSATGADGASVSITVNGSSHTSGAAAAWNTGTNTVAVTASKAGYSSTVYTVTVTKAAG